MIHPYRQRAHMPPLAPEDRPRIYVEAAGVTLQWLAKRHDFNTVCEYNWWLGYDVPDDAEISRERRVVLMQCDHNAILKIHELLYAKDAETAELVLKARALGSDTVLGYDFQRNAPMLMIYPPTRKADEDCQ